MSDVATIDKEQLRTRLRQLLRTVPASVVNGSYQQAVAYKKWYAEMSKLANSERTSASQLEAAILQAKSYR